MGSRRENRTRSLTLIAALAVVYTVLRVIPTFPMVGVPGSRFTSSDFVASLYGVILGAFSGAFCIVLGTFIAFLLGRPPVFLGLDFLPAMVNALVVGLAVRGRRGYAALIYLLLLAAFLGHPFGATLVRVTPFWSRGSLTFPFVWLHIIGLVVLLSPAGLRFGRLIAEPSIRLNAAGFSLLSLVGTLTQHLTGNLLYASIILPMLSEEARTASWALIFWLYPVERIMIVAMSTIIGVPIIRAVRSSSFVKIKGRSEVSTSKAEG